MRKSIPVKCAIVALVLALALGALGGCAQKTPQASTAPSGSASASASPSASQDKPRQFAYLPTTMANPDVYKRQLFHTHPMNRQVHRPVSGSSTLLAK